MKKVILYNWLIIALEYTIVYLVKTFIIWEFTNPFQWIIDLPTCTEGMRFMILFYFLAWQIIQPVIIYKVVNGKSHPKSK